MGLKVFNLQCDAGHLFEGWFRSHDDYDDQHQRGLIECPVCQSSTVDRMPSAPRLNMGKAHEPDNAGTPGHEPAAVMAGASDEIARIQAVLLQQLRQYVRSAEDVGVQFAQEARRIHEGDAEARPIRGVATREEREELAEDGIAVVVVPDFLDNDRLN